MVIGWSNPSKPLDRLKGRVIIKENIAVTEHEQNNPAFRIITFDEETPGDTVGCLSLADNLVNEYEDTFESPTNNGDRETQKDASAKRDQN